MPLTYSQNSGSSVTATNNTLSFSGLDYRPEIGDTIEVYNDTTKLTETTDYTLDTTNKNVLFVVNNSALTFTPGTTISVYRIAKKDTRAIDFQNASVLTEADLDNSAFQTFHIAQEALDTAEQSITVNADGTFNANNARIVNLADPSGDQDAATKAWVNSNANTTTVAGSIANVNAVAGQITPTNNIATVANSAYKTDIETVADSTYKAKVETVGDSTYKSKVETVADSTYKGKVETVAESVYKGKVETVADSTYKSKVETVANNDANVTKVANIDANVTKVANIDSNVTTVANNDANVTKVANIDSDVTTVAGLGTNGAHVTTVATNNANVTAVANNIADVNNFADTYFGTSSSASGPTGTFTAGDLYFSTYNSENKLKVYNGSSWQNATSAVEGIATITEFTPNGSDTHFAFTHDVGLQIVFLNGVRLIQGTDYNSVNSSSSTSNITSGTATHLHFSTPPANGDVLSAMGFGTVTSTAVVPVSGGTFSGNVAVNGDLTVDTDTLKVDSANNAVLVGQTSGYVGDSASASGFRVQSDGFLDVAKSGTYVMRINRQGSQGEIISFRRDGASVGSIGAEGSDHLTIGTEDTGVLFSDGHNAIHPWNVSSNATRDNAIDLGRSTHRFKDLHLGGNVVIGTSGNGINFNATSDGSGASNVNEILSDYEQGTFTPLLKGVDGDPSYGGSAFARYTKVGNVVHFNVLIDVNPYSSDGSGQIFIKGFPFNFDGNYAGNAPAIHVTLWGPTIGSGKFIAGQGVSSDNSMKFKIWQSGGGQSFWTYSTASISAGQAIYVQGHYFVA